MFKKLSLELGGKNPNIIFADCNYEKMLSITVKSSFANQGQICLCGSRIFVEKSIYLKFKNDFVSRVKQLKVGNPFDSSTQIGALVSKPHLDKVMSYIDLAIEESAKVLYGGNKLIVKGSENGYYLEPTIIEVTDNNCRVNQEEIFGPIVTIMPFDTEESFRNAIMSSTGFRLPCGLAILTRTMRMSKQIESGIVLVKTWLNRDLKLFWRS